MNPTRRDVLKALLLAPVAAIVPGAALAAPSLKPISLPEAKDYLAIGSRLTRRFILKVDKQEFGDWSIVRTLCDMAGRVNADWYRGFAPGTLRIEGAYIHRKQRLATVEFCNCVETGVTPSDHPVMKAIRDRALKPFAGLPRGDFIDTGRIEYETFLVDQNGNRIS